MLLKKVQGKYISLFQSEPRLYRSPARLTLLGDHTDYNNGLAIAAAINKETIFAVAKNQSDIGRVHSLNLDKYFEFNVDSIERSGDWWCNYILGVVKEFRNHGHIIGGFDCVLGSDIPIGSGLSSSTALTGGTGYFLNQIFQLGLSQLEIATYAMTAENDFIGIKCGILDHFVNMMAKTNHFSVVDCLDLTHEFLEVDLPNYRLILFDPQVKHRPEENTYERCRPECEQSIKIIKKYFPNVSSLRDCRHDMLLKCKAELGPVLFRRCQFVVEENNRVLQGVEDLKKNRLVELGKKMYASHLGLRNEYEVSCEALDFLIDTVKTYNDVLGARMMGPGIGGCTINLVKDHDLEEFISSVQQKYKKKFRNDLLTYKVKFTKATCEINQ